eukprot:12980375-Heterocapsa_arctica.AAC.1
MPSSWKLSARSLKNALLLSDMGHGNGAAGTEIRASCGTRVGLGQNSYGHNDMVYGTSEAYTAHTRRRPPH